MKKRTLVAVLIFLLATLTGLTRVAALPPALSPTIPNDTRLLVPTITEQAALVIEPGRVRQLSLPLNAGDEVSGRVTVIPEDVSFVVHDPYGKVVFSGGRITEKAFSFVAATRGIYELVFGNSLFLLANKVVLVEVTHPGAEVFPHFSGTYVAVNPASVKTVAIKLAANQGVEGSFQVEGGIHDIVFSVSDPNGNTAVSAGRVYRSHAFSFTATVAGTYQLNFDNSFSSHLSKLVSLRLSASPGGQWWWGAATKLAFTTSPVGATAGSPLGPQPEVTVQDAAGNTVTSYSGDVTLAISSGTGTSGAILSGTTTVSIMAGVAIFVRLSIDLAGTGYTLTATSSGLTSAVSRSFNVEPVLPVNCVALSAGWNFISLPLVPGNTAITSVLSNILNSVVSVWHYDAASTNWSNYVPNLGGTLTTMTDGKGYLINMSAPAILAINSAASAASPTYAVVPGWNMIGFKSTALKSVSAYLSGTSYRSFPIYGHASGAYMTINPSTQRLQPGSGYWVFFNTPGVIRP